MPRSNHIRRARRERSRIRALHAQALAADARRAVWRIRLTRWVALGFALGVSAVFTRMAIELQTLAHVHRLPVPPALTAIGVLALALGTLARLFDRRAAMLEQELQTTYLDRSGASAGSSR